MLDVRTVIPPLYVPPRVPRSIITPSIQVKPWASPEAVSAQPVIWPELLMIYGTVQSPPIEQGSSYQYEIRARWMNENGEEMDQIRAVQVNPGDRVEVNFMQED